MIYYTQEKEREKQKGKVNKMTRLEEILLIERELEKIGYDNKTEKGIYLHKIAFKYATGKYVSKDEFKKCFE